jgi:hypothetical protein
MVVYILLETYYTKKGVNSFETVYDDVNTIYSNYAAALEAMQQLIECQKKDWPDGQIQSWMNSIYLAANPEGSGDVSEVRLWRKDFKHYIRYKIVKRNVYDEVK